MLGGRRPKPWKIACCRRSGAGRRIEGGGTAWDGPWRPRQRGLRYSSLLDRMTTQQPIERPIERPIEQQRETVTQFFPLLDVAPPFERGELLRVMVPASTMRRVGLPVNENRLADPVYADVLVGQEGLARAIRFVSYEH